MKAFLTAVILFSVIVFGGGAAYRAWEAHAVKSAVEKAVLERLVAPATAKFSEYKVKKIRVRRETYLSVSGCVDADNRSGAFVRSDYSAKVINRDQVEDLELVPR